MPHPLALPRCGGAAVRQRPADWAEGREGLEKLRGDRLRRVQDWRQVCALF